MQRVLLVGLPGAGASGINIIDSRLQNPTVHAFNLGVELDVQGTRVRVDGVHNTGTNFLIGRTVGQVFNPVVGIGNALAPPLLEHIT